MTKTKVLQDNKNINKYIDKYIILKQSTARIIIKSVLYRLLGILVTLIWSYLITNDLTLSIKVSLLIEVTQTIIYFLYENGWNNIKWGYITYYEDSEKTKTKTQVIGTDVKEIDNKLKKSALKKIEGPGIKSKIGKNLQIIYDPSNNILI